jgi:hypothetical protein
MGHDHNTKKETTVFFMIISTQRAVSNNDSRVVRGQRAKFHNTKYKNMDIYRRTSNILGCWCQNNTGNLHTEGIP